MEESNIKLLNAFTSLAQALPAIECQLAVEFAGRLSQGRAGEVDR